MSHEAVDADLRAAFELHRSRILQLKQNCLAKLFEILEVSLDTTDPEELEVVWYEEWAGNGRLPNTIKSGSDFKHLIDDDGTKPPLPQEKRLQIFTEIETVLKDRAILKTDPLTLPEDFKQLCALTESLTGPGLGNTNCGIPHAFDGASGPLASLRFPLEQEYLVNAVGLWCLDYETSVILTMGDVHSCAGGGTWLCWCKHDCSDDWKWRWVTRHGYEQPPHIYEDVKDMLERYWKTYLNVIQAVYDDDMGQDGL